MIGLSIHLYLPYVFIPDLRNSGQSAEGITHMGNNLGEDLTAALLILHHDFGQDTLIVYAFSMGTLAVCNMLGRTELSTLLKQNEIIVEKIIFESPLVNVRETLRRQFSQYPVMPWYFDKTFNLFSKSISGFGDSMRMSLLLLRDVPTLILQTKNDQTTINDILDIELSEMPDHDSMRVIYFEGSGHVKIFQDAGYHVQFLEVVGDFLGTDSSQNP
jgi:pimeloyl-ACP methyl ester carboxylesterase